jgi:hypothetical protein
VITLDQLAKQVDPDRTVLFLGAGASVPSGGPLAAQLASAITKRLGAEPISQNLVDVASLLELRVGRAALIKAIREEIGELQPTGGLLTLPNYDWHAIYTTNYDELIEKAYKKANKPYTVTSSNYDFGARDVAAGTPIYKIHGTIGKDEIDGYKFRLIVTDSDYEQSSSYREGIFASLQQSLLANDVIIVGYSLSDPDLRDQITKAGQLHQTQNTPTRLYAVIYTSDPERATLIERRGIHVAFGGIDEFAHYLAGYSPSPTLAPTSTSGPGYNLPARLQIASTDVNHARGLQPDAVRLFHGSPATYGDIAHRLTFSRSIEPSLTNQLRADDKPFAVVLGVEGVGKTTTVRQSLLALNREGYLAWEHRGDFSFNGRAWIQVEHHLRTSGLKGVLFVDDCPPFLSEVNALCDSLGTRTPPALKVILASTPSEWGPRSKSPAIFRGGETYSLSQLTDGEIAELVTLLEREPSIQSQVDPAFSRQNRYVQLTELRRRCGADMFVCLKNIFANEELDAILLREYGRLRPEIQDMYRHVAALQAAGARVHRQLIIRTLGLNMGAVKAILELSEGIINEYDIDPADGLYGWSTRHELIAQTITNYKFSDEYELYSLLDRVITNLVPTIPLEMRTLRDICNFRFGVGRLNDVNQQIELYRKMIGIAPRERVPRHRLIASLIDRQELDQAGQEIRNVEDAIGLDPPAQRYKVRLALRRAELTVGLLEEDRVAMIKQAKTLALKGITTFPRDKYAYMAYGEVGVAWAEHSRGTEVLDDAIAHMAAATETILDPQLSEELRKLERTRDRFAPPSAR